MAIQTNTSIEEFETKCGLCNRTIEKSQIMWYWRDSYYHDKCYRGINRDGNKEGVKIRDVKSK